ncbi:MAG: nucleotidyltransferase family protein [Paludibacteraceae bacterium]|nr:nucleotidyltransferase family protein [Paludibacteraceae bacterium]
MNDLFFELIQVSLGNRKSLSRAPSGKEWKALFEMAQIQSLVGITFAGVQILEAQGQCPDESLYFLWMGLSVKVRLRNEIANKQCIELQKRLSDEGIKSCILKGQGVALSYGKLSTLRQCGDIDIWVDETIEECVRKVRSLGVEVHNINIVHAKAKFFKSTEVEIHFRPSCFYNPIINNRFIHWISEMKTEQMGNQMHEMVVPTVEFNLVYLLIHIYRHLLNEGVGLRQLMDYYFVLQTNSLSEEKIQDAYRILKKLRLDEFASSIMWILVHVFGAAKVPWPQNEKGGSKLLAEVMRHGNFGIATRKNEYKNALERGLANFKRNLIFLPYFSGEILWSPIWKTWHWFFRKKYND